MPDVFISYSSKDKELADSLYRHLKSEGTEVFMAHASLKPGQTWAEEVKRNLKNSDWVIFLASKAACKSHYVLEELGMALSSEKKLVPIVWDMEPSNQASGLGGQISGP